MAAFPPSSERLEPKGILTAWPKCRVLRSQGLQGSSEGRDTGTWCGPRGVGSAGPGYHMLCYAFGRGTRQLLGCQRHLWWCQCCEPGPASRAWRAAAVSQREQGDFSSPRYLVHLDGSLGPLQCGGVGLLQPQGQRFLKPLMEVAQSQRSIPVEEGTSSPTTQQWHRTITPPALTSTPARDQPQNLW